MAVITWRDLLSQSSAASLADDDLRELVAEFATGLGESFYWPGSAASQGASTSSSGEMLPGGARVPGVAVLNTALFDALDGEITAAYWPGTVTLQPTLLHGGSTSSFVIGGGIAIESSPTPEAATPFTSRWVTVDSATSVIISGTEADNSFATNVPSLGTLFGAVPNVQVSLEVNPGALGAGDSVIHGVDSVTINTTSPDGETVSACSSYVSFIGLPGFAGSVVTMNIRSEGTVAL